MIIMTVNIKERAPKTEIKSSHIGKKTTIIVNIDLWVFILMYFVTLCNRELPPRICTSWNNATETAQVNNKINRGRVENTKMPTIIAQYQGRKVSELNMLQWNTMKKWKLNDSGLVPSPLKS